MGRLLPDQLLPKAKQCWAWGSSHELNIKPKFFSQVYILHTHVLSSGARMFLYF